MVFYTPQELPHIDKTQLMGRSILLAPVWDGEVWKTWVPAEQGKLIKLSIVDVAQSHYLAKNAAHEQDIYIPFIEFLWQHMSWPEVHREVSGITQDIHLMATSAAKLEHYYASKETIGPHLVTAFVNSEIEQLLVVARSAFDLLQATLAGFWNKYVRLLDPVMDENRRQRKMPPTFSKVVLDDESLRPAEKIAERYSLPIAMAEMYAKHGPFFQSLRKARDHVVHLGKTPDSVFSTERGFCVDPKARYFRDFPWTEEHYYNENIVTLVPWVAQLVCRTLEACSDIVLSLNGQIALPPALAPDHHVFLRDPTNPALLRLVDAAQGSTHWWREAPSVSQ
jgi:hypothetical protein